MNNGFPTELSSYKEQWRSALEKRLPDLLMLVDEYSLGSWTEVFGIPVSVIAGVLHDGLDILYSGLDDALGMRYAQKCAEMIERVERESNLLELRRDYDSLSRGDVLLCKALCAGILHERLDRDAYTGSAEEYLGWIFERRPRGWDDQYQSYCISAVLSYLTIDELPTAAALVEKIRGIRWYQPAALPLCDLVEALHLGRPVPRSASDALLRYFDELRAPEFGPDYFVRRSQFRVELAAVLSKYLLHGGKDFTWRGLIELISA